MNTFVNYPAFLTSSKNKKEYYTYYCKKENMWVITDEYQEYLNHTKRDKMGGDRGVHFPKHDPLFQTDLIF